MEGLLAMWNITKQILIVLVEENPKKAGSASRERFNLYRHGMTSQEAKEAGVTGEDLRHDLEKGFIKFITPADFQTK